MNGLFLVVSGLLWRKLSIISNHVAGVNKGFKYLLTCIFAISSIQLSQSPMFLSLCRDICVTLPYVTN